MELASVEAIPSVVHHNVQCVVESSFIVVHIHWREVALLLVHIERLEF